MRRPLSLLLAVLLFAAPTLHARRRSVGGGVDVRTLSTEECFFKMKHRVLEYLVENMGFTVFAIEASLPEADAVNEYVLHGTGDPAQALAGMFFWTWHTQEVLDMIEWMRAYNLRRGDEMVVFDFGFVFDRGTFNAHNSTGLGSNRVDSPASGVETTLRSVAPRMIIDLRNIVSVAARDYFAAPRLHCTTC